MGRREKIQDLLLSLNSLSFDDDRRLEIFLEKTRINVRDIFGDYNSYLTCLSCIQFYPPSPLSSAEENVRYWAQAKKELRDLLHVMLEDPQLFPSEPCRSRVLAQFTDEEPVPRYEIGADITGLTQELKIRVREDLELAGHVNFASFSFRNSRGGPRPMERIRIDLRDLFILQKGQGSAKEQRALDMSKEMTKRIFFLPGTSASTNSEVFQLLHQSHASVIEGEPLTPGGASIQEQFSRQEQITTAVMVLSDDCLFEPKRDGREAAVDGPLPVYCFALGFLVGHLGRKHVIAIYTDGKRFKRPTNYFDAVYIACDRTGLWKKEVVVCLNEQGIKLESPVTP
jgi:predicted nucleotide-binding protein